MIVKIWKIGRMEGWKDGRLEEWIVGNKVSPWKVLPAGQDDHSLDSGLTALSNNHWTLLRSTRFVSEVRDEVTKEVEIAFDNST